MRSIGVEGRLFPLQGRVSKKYFCFSEIFACRLTQITSNFRHPVPLRGALRNVINAGRGAVDADGAFDESA
jgi:hypothetical protein